MFGYVGINPQALSGEEQARFRALYCGLCHVLYAEYGTAGRLTLSNDMTFLSLLLCALYEPAETRYDERCVLHPAKKHAAVVHAGASYAAAMNILLAYHKCLDDVADEGSLQGRAGKAALEKAYRRVEAQYPAQCAAVGQSLARCAALERERQPDLDALARCSGEMLGACFAWKDDVFAPHLREMGAALGRFIYLMDAYEDYDADVKRGRFNPLGVLHALPDYEARMEDILSLEMAACVRAFDYLPIEQDANLIRSILYSGVWSRYAALQQKRKETKS